MPIVFKQVEDEFVKHAKKAIKLGGFKWGRFRGHDSLNPQAQELFTALCRLAASEIALLRQERLNLAVLHVRQRDLLGGLIDATAHLEAAASAYSTFSGNDVRPGRRDTLYNTRSRDFERAITRCRKLLQVHAKSGG